MADDYRKPAAPKAPARPRGPVVRRADDPEPEVPFATGADPRKKALFAAQAATVAAELEAARRTMANTARVVGALLLALVVGDLVLMRPRYAELGYLVTSEKERGVLGVCLVLGLWLVAFGNGGAADVHHAPTWFRWGTALAALLGVMLAATGVLVPALESLLALTL